MQSFAAIVIFGATGDLAQRMLFPSLYNLDADGLLGDTVRIHGAARSKLDESAFRDQVSTALDSYLPEGRIDETVKARFLDRLGYCPVDIDTPADFECLAAKIGTAKDAGVAFYLSTPPRCSPRSWRVSNRSA